MLRWKLHSRHHPSCSSCCKSSVEVRTKLTSSETAAQENATAYFPLLDRIADGRFAEYTSDHELYNAFLDTLRTDDLLGSKEALATFELAMSIHASAPRIEAHYQYYQTSVEPLLPAAQDAACPVWAHFEGKQYCSPTLERAQQDFEAENHRKLPFDRILNSNPDVPIATLYVDITAPALAQFHQELRTKAQSGQLAYRVRYRPSLESTQPLPLSGYGVELQLKRTDYIVIDDRNGDAETPPADPVESDIDDLKPLSTSQLAKLSLKTAGYVLDSADPFETLERVSQDFPKYSFAIANTNDSEKFVEEHKLNRGSFLGSGYNVVWMNGLQVDFRGMNAFALLDRLRRERNLVENLRDIGLSAREAIALLSHRAVTEAKSSEDTVRYDYRDMTEGGRCIVWLNNIEKDKRYAGWPSAAAMLLQPSYPGQLPSIRRDIHNVVVPVDLADPADLEEIVNSLQALIRRLVPVQFGFVPRSASAESIQRAKVVYYLQEKYGLGVVLQYLTYLLAEGKNAPTTASKVSTFVQSHNLRKGREALPITDVLDGPEYEERVESAKRYLRRLGATGESPPSFINGAIVPRNDAWMQSMSGRISMDTQIIQQQIFENTIEDDTWIAGHFIDGAPVSRNALIMPDDEDNERVVDLGEIFTRHTRTIATIPKIPADSETLKQFWSHNMIVVDVESPAGVQLLTSAIEWRKNQPEAELLVIHNGAPSTESNPISTALFEVAMAGSEMTTVSLAQVLEAAVATPGEGGLSEQAVAFWEQMQPLVRDLGLQPGDNFAVLNGRTVGPVSEDDLFDADAFTQLLKYEQKKRITPVTTALADLQLDDRLASPLALARVTTMIALSGKSGEPEGIFGNTPTIRMNHFVDWQSNHTAIVTGDADTALIQIVASIEPTSPMAQRWIPILHVLSKLDGVSLKLFLNPRDVISELPIKRFYRHVLQPKLQFDEEGRAQAPRASFEGLPKKALLNFGMDLPPAWLVSPKESIHDLDNIRLSSLKDGQSVDAVYELEHILIEGHSRDITTGSQPRGTQLWLGTEKDEHFADTLIMNNLGYFQFKANPGHWNIQLKPGRSQEVFHIDNIGLEGYSKEVHEGRLDATLMSFQGLTLYPTISRNPGHEDDDVLEDGTKGAAGSYAAKASKLASGFLANVGLGKKTEQADINIFSVASGHLYERMLNIMMLSVMKHTRRSVKFWFIEQFLSPSFKRTLPALAAEYGFAYEMVTYKWPHWLRAQSEKQREIWGYKILFLDVLFPLALDKVIFVDADQIVRADMYELVAHDLQGAPYGFAPMCDSRTEMEGFRFWKQGYWANFLRGRPYHISALYVVDLRRFRALAAGDRLRQQYHQLSADPHSLANLDQDLPNNMQAALPIHSLPQEWLWCETWCSDESLKDAKTIDLCNNPQTFEPKLDRARRQVPEWTVYDNEIAEVIRRRHGADEAVVGQQGENVQEALERDKAQKEEEASSADEAAAPSPEHASATTGGGRRGEKDEL